MVILQHPDCGMLYYEKVSFDAKLIRPNYWKLKGQIGLLSPTPTCVTYKSKNSHYSFPVNVKIIAHSHGN